MPSPGLAPWSTGCREAKPPSLGASSQAFACWPTRGLRFSKKDRDLDPAQPQIRSGT